MIHVCSLAALPDTVKATGASHVLTVMANVDQVLRPESVLPANHLKVSMDDITEHADGFVAPSEQHIETVLAFVRGWDRNAPMVVHCYAGISRSTFYSHFTGKDDLLLSDAEEFFKLMASLLVRRRENSLRLVPVAEMLSHLREARAFYLALVASGKKFEVMELGEGLFARGIVFQPDLVICHCRG